MFQIATHVDVVPLPTLYEWCRVARRLLDRRAQRRPRDRASVHRASPAPSSAARTPGLLGPAARADAARPVPSERGVAVYGVGKIQDIFAQQGLTEARYSDSNDDGVDLTIDYLRRPGPRSCSATWSTSIASTGTATTRTATRTRSRRSTAGSPSSWHALRRSGVLFLTGDHGCDPTTPSTDHSRERTPLLAAGRRRRAVRRGRPRRRTPISGPRPPSCSASRGTSRARASPGRSGGDRPRDVVAAKRDGRELDPDELRGFVLGYARGEVPDYLASAFLMAAFVNGLDAGETLALTRAMVDSGETLPLDGISRPKVDKHSTGGVADGVTLVFAPIAASLGLAVAKLSGRGLGAHRRNARQARVDPGPADRSGRRRRSSGRWRRSVWPSRRRRPTSSRPTAPCTRCGTRPRRSRRSRSSPRA